MSPTTRDPSTQHRSAVEHVPEARRLRRRVGPDRAECGALPAGLATKTLFWRCALALALLAGCDEDAPLVEAGLDAGLDSGLDAGLDGARRDAGLGALRFRLVVENVAGGAFPTGLSSALWVLHTDADPLFTEGAPDRGQGLESLAEDGDPSALAARLETGRAGILAGPLAPGEGREAIFTAPSPDARLSLAAMVMESNDVFIAPSGRGVALFDVGGHPLPAREVTDELFLWNAGTEADQAPGQGPHQPARQAHPDDGPPEGVIRHFDASTRALPLARDLVDVQVAWDGSALTITIENVAAARRLLITDLSPVVWAVHDASHRLFELGAPDDGRGLEELAEDGQAGVLLRSLASASGVLASGVTDRRLRAGERAEITVHPDAGHPLLTFAASVLETNDALVALPAVRLLEAGGVPRPVRAIALDIRRELGVFDAGTEANEVPGAGLHQATRQRAPNSGATDPDRRVRLYADATNDLAGPRAGGYLDIEVRHAGGTSFDVRVTNTSRETPNPGMVSSTLYVVHDGQASLFTLGGHPSPGLEVLAEDCGTGLLGDELRGAAGVREALITNIPAGRAGHGPLMLGDSYEVRVTADATHRWLNVATMPFPSSDLFVALGERGVALLDERGVPRDGQVIRSDVLAALRAYDAGTEANQSGAAGHDMPPFQESGNLGAREGDGTVRREADPVWSYPEPRELVRVWIEPLP